MKTLLVHIKTLKKIGGVRTHGINIIKNLPGEVWVIQTARNPKKEVKLKTFGRKSVRMLEYKEPWFPKDFRARWPLEHKKEIEKKFKSLVSKNINFDLVVSMNPCSVIPALKVFKNSVFLIASCDKAYYKSIKNDITSGERKFWRNLLKIEKEIVENKKIKIIVLSNFMKRILKKSYPNSKAKISVVYPGIEKRKINKKRSFDVLTVARMDPVKNIPSLLRVAKNLKRAKFTIVGDGPELNRLKEISQRDGLNNVIFTGRKVNPSPFYAKSKIFILPSKYESFGLVFLEAMSFGVPCIAFKPNGKKINTASDEIIKDGKTGFLVKNEKEMTEKIQLLLHDKALWRKMSSASKKESLKYSWKKHVQKIIKFANSKE